MDETDAAARDVMAKLASHEPESIWETQPRTHTTPDICPECKKQLMRAARGEKFWLTDFGGEYKVHVCKEEFEVPNFCHACGMDGHDTTNCKTPDPTMQEAERQEKKPEGGW